MGTLSTLALQSSLTTQLDEKLTAAHRRTVDGPVRVGGIAVAPDQAADEPPRTDRAARSDPARTRAPSTSSCPTAPTPPTSPRCRRATSTTTATWSRSTRRRPSSCSPCRPTVQPVSIVLSDLGSYRAIASVATDGTTTVTALPTTSVTSTVTTFVAVEVVVAALALLVAAAAGMVLVRRELRPLDRVVGTANRVARLPLDRGEVVLADRVPARDTDPATEVGQVGAALNKLLGHVEQALGARHESESQVRQFVADASHELRTPLASIRGYAELVRRSPDDVPVSALQAMSRVESESERMTALLEDMLLLARLDAGRPLASEPVDLTVLAIDAVTDAHAAGPDHDWRLDLPSEDAPRGRPRARRRPPPAPGAGQPPVERPAAHARRHRRDRPRPSHRRPGRPAGVRRRPRHPARPAREPVPAVHARRRLPQQRHGVHRPRPGDRARGRHGPRRHHHGVERPRHHVHGHPPGRARRLTLPATSAHQRVPTPFCADVSASTRATSAHQRVPTHFCADVAVAGAGWAREPGRDGRRCLRGVVMADLSKAFSGFSTDDVPAARAFYADVLGLDVSEENGMLFLRFESGHEVLVYPKGPAHEPAGYTVLNFPVEDVPGTVAELRERGVPFEKYAGTPVETDDDFVFRGGGPLIAWFTDPAGNILSIIEAS